VAGLEEIMEYFKDDNIIGELPNWIEQSIRLGYLLAKNSKCEKHQILLISAPDESAIAPFSYRSNEGCL